MNNSIDEIDASIAQLSVQKAKLTALRDATKLGAEQMFGKEDSSDES